MYLRKIRPRTTCLYSAASMLLRSASAAAQSFCSNSRLAPFSVLASDLPLFAIERGSSDLFNEPILKKREHYIHLLVVCLIDVQFEISENLLPKVLFRNICQGWIRFD